MEGQAPHIGANHGCSGKGKAPQSEVTQQPSLGSAYPYCFNCHSIVSEAFTCIENGHSLLPHTEMPKLEMMTEDMFNSQHSYTADNFSISATDSAQYFSHDDMTQTSYTENSLSPSTSYSDFYIGQLPGFPSFASSSKVSLQNDASSGFVNQPEFSDAFVQPEIRNNVRTVDDLGLSAHQESALQFFKAQWFEQHVCPDDSDLQALATLTKLNVDVLRRWFAISTRRESPEIDPLNDTEIDDDMLQAVAQFAQQRVNRPCENSQAKKAPSHFRYKCTFGCRYSSHDWDSWRRHLKSKYPQNFWICKLCHRAKRSPCVWFRMDKMDDHMKKVHSSIEKSQRTQICKSSQVHHQADFPSTCPFSSRRGPCRFRPSSWDEYIRHCKEHFEDSIDNGPWQLPFNARRPPDDDNEGSGSSKSLGRRALPKQRPSSTGYAANGAASGKDGSHSSQRENSHSRNSDCMFPDHVLSDSRDDLRLVEKLNGIIISVGYTDPSPFMLIDIEQQAVVPASSEAKYLCCDYSWASRAIKLSESAHMALFASSISLTRSMGYRYLWIDRFCGPNSRDRKTIFNKALLTIFMVKFDEMTEKMWHFTCHYKNFGNVLKWVEQGVVSMSCSHIRNLGHGSYGIVDEVQLSVEPQPMARKMYLRWKQVDEEGSMPVKELEMLQKLEHDNIPKFIAAYVSSNALNILMLPVAECNLKEFLAQPESWPGNRPHLASWFLPLVSALSYIHGMSCRHKDIKPANILVKGHQVYLSDFGAASDFSSVNGSNSWGGGIMTPKYCAPEVARRGRRGRKADMFSLGCVFLEMITVELGLSLKDLNRHLRFGKDLKRHLASRPSSIYSHHIKCLKDWLRRLRARTSTLLHISVLDACEGMLDFDPTRRPDAQQVFEALRGQLMGLTLQQPSSMLKIGMAEFAMKLQPAAQSPALDLFLNEQRPFSGFVHVDTIIPSWVVNMSSPFLTKATSPYTTRHRLNCMNPVRVHKKCPLIVNDNAVSTEIAVVGKSKFSEHSMDDFWKVLSNSSEHELKSSRSRRYADRADVKERWGGMFPLRHAASSATSCGRQTFYDQAYENSLSWDPQLRLFLEVTLEALENAGYHEYLERSRAISTSRNFTGRISYIGNHFGPSFTLDTACSSSAVCIQQAVDKFWNSDITDLGLTAIDLPLSSPGFLDQNYDNFGCSFESGFPNKQSRKRVPMTNGEMSAGHWSTLRSAKRLRRNRIPSCGHTRCEFRCHHDPNPGRVPQQNVKLPRLAYADYEPPPPSVYLGCLHTNCVHKCTTPDSHESCSKLAYHADMWVCCNCNLGNRRPVPPHNISEWANISKHIARSHKPPHPFDKKQWPTKSEIPNVKPSRKLQMELKIELKLPLGKHTTLPQTRDPHVWIVSYPSPPTVPNRASFHDTSSQRHSRDSRRFLAPADFAARSHHHNQRQTHSISGVVKYWKNKRHFCPDGRTCSNSRCRAHAHLRRLHRLQMMTTPGGGDSLLQRRIAAVENQGGGGEEEGERIEDEDDGRGEEVKDELLDENCGVKGIPPGWEDGMI